MATIKHVTFGERHNVADLHPEFARQCPNLTRPYLAETTPYPDEFPYAFYALEDGVVATSINSFFDILSMNGRQFGWAWNGNLFTHPAFRGRGLAQQIIEAQVTEFARLGLVWGGTFSSDPALRLYRKLGFTVVGSAQRMCLLRNPAPFLSHHLNARPLISLVSKAYRALYRAAHRLLRQGAFERKYCIEEIDIERLQDVLTRYPIRYQDRAHWCDDAELLAAKIDSRNLDRIVLVRDAANEPILFMVWRVRETTERPIKEKYRGVRMFSVMDFGYLQDPEPAQALIDAAICLFDEAKADLLEIVTAPSLLTRAARRRGLLPLGTGMSFTFKAPEGHPLRNKETKVADWHLTHFSGDGYSYE